MGWFSAALLVIAASCLTLAAIHAHVWLRERRVTANGAFAVLAASVAGLAVLELQMVKAPDAASFGRWLWWYHIPVWTGLVSTVFFVRLHLRCGRAWLGWTAIGLRTLALVINLASSPNINYLELTGLDHVTFLGERLAWGRGETNPLLVIAQASLVVLIVFVADAAWAAWGQGMRQRAVTIGASMVVFVSAGLTLAVLSYWGLAGLPALASIFFLPIVLFMGFDLSLELIRSVRLAAELDAKSMALQESEQKLAFAAEAARAGLWSVDRATGRLWATPQALSMFGLVADREHHVDEVLAPVHPDDRDRVRAFIAGPGSETDGTALEYRVVLPSGETRWHGARGAAHVDPDGARMLMGATIDITERKRAEEQTARQRIELEHLSRVATLSELSGALAHELNQPLAIIMSNAEAAQVMLQRPDPDLDEIRAILKDVIDADERAGEVIRRLRGLLKRGAPQRQPVALEGLVQGVLQFVRADLLRRGVSLEFEFDAGGATVSADRVPIEQVLINLINNACDAMAGNAPGDRTLKISTWLDGRQACVCVADVGVGLPPDPERVFDTFYTTKPEGLGMGLAISRSIVAAHGGRLTGESTPPRGAAFTVCLPLMEATP
ncbi:MAG: sensor histidine kinase [Betaproteobacteria bacterium]